MNLIILEASDFHTPSRIVLHGRRFDHITQVLKAQPGDKLSVGLLNGGMGHATITDVQRQCIVLEPGPLDQTPPPALPLTLILGLPRPRMLQRTLQTIATMGVAKMILVQTSRVEKSFWQTPLLKESTIREQLILGLEQGKATQLPEVVFHKRFRPFIEDYLPEQMHNKQPYIAHPGPYPAASKVPEQDTLLAIGPEGGFRAQEVEQFTALGFQPIQLGARILRVETAIPVLIGKLF